MLTRSYSWLMYSAPGQVVLAVTAVPICLIWWPLLTAVLVNAGLLALNLGLLRLSRRKGKDT